MGVRADLPSGAVLNGARPERRVDPLTGAVVYVAGGRQSRPNLPDRCPFCPGGLEAPQPYDVLSFPNRWPPLPDGRAEVLVYSPQHDLSLSDLGGEGVRRVVDLWAARTSALGSRDDVAYVLLFENRGSVVGATIDHPHGQLYSFDEIPDVPARELARPGCVLCDLDIDGRTVVERSGWWAAVPVAPTWPYEVLLAPVEHLADLPSIPSDGRDGMAEVLRDVLSRLDQLFEEPMPYMMWIHQRPTDGREWPTAHVHVHIAPVLRAPGRQRYVAAGELGSGVWFDPIEPEEAAAALARLPGAPA